MPFTPAASKTLWIEQCVATTQANLEARGLATNFGNVETHLQAQFRCVAL